LLGATGAAGAVLVWTTAGGDGDGDEGGAVPDDCAKAVIARANEPTATMALKRNFIGHLQCGDL
jgi:hypothetical protein